MKKQQHKICEVCSETFIPDHRVGDRQRVCNKLACQRERKRRAQQRWIANNPTYFQGRYPETKAWLDEHPGYLKRYRAQKKVVMSTSATDIQDELTANYSNEIDINVLIRLHDIQDKITYYFNKYFNCLQLAVPLIYKTR
jgi:hypothetical protein